MPASFCAIGGACSSPDAAPVLVAWKRLVIDFVGKSCLTSTIRRIFCKSSPNRPPKPSLAKNAGALPAFPKASEKYGFGGRIFVCRLQKKAGICQKEGSLRTALWTSSAYEEEVSDVCASRGEAPRMPRLADA
jgi:hypothetical protein